MVRDATAEPLVAGPSRTRHLLPRLAIGLTLLPLIASAVALIVDVGTGYHAWGDQALTELQVRDVGRHPVLVGLYSRDGWNHFGPALFYLLALPYHLTGDNSIGLHLGALLINGAAITGMAVIAKRRGGTPLLLLTLLGTAALVRTLGPDFLHDPWVPFIPVLPFGLLVFLTWAMTEGDAWALPVGAGVAVFCAQTHAGYALLALPLVLAGTAWLVVGSVRTGRPARHDLMRAGLVAAAVVAVASIPPAIEQLTNSPGNVTEVADYTNQRDPEAGRPTWADGARVVGDQFTLTPEWLTGADPAHPFTGEPTALDATPVPVLLVPFLLAGVVAVRRRWTDAARLAGTVAAALVLGMLSITRVIGTLFVYRLRWTWVLGMLAVVTVTWVAWKLVPAGTAVGRWLAPVALAVLVPVSAVNAVSAARAGIPYEPESTALPAIASEVVDALPRRGGEVVVRSDTFSGNLYAAALVLLLEERGVDIGVERANEEAFGEHRVHREGRVRATLVVYEGLDTLVPRPELGLVAASSDLSRVERARSTARRAALDAEHEAGTIADERYIVELGKIEARVRSSVAVFIEPEN